MVEVEPQRANEMLTQGARHLGVSLEDVAFDKGVDAGLDSVRLAVRWSHHATLTAEATLGEEFAVQVDHAVDEPLKRNLVVGLNMHHARRPDGDRLDPGESPVDPSVLRPRFLKLWKHPQKRNRSGPGLPDA
jgi:hypothetical protein